MTNSSLEQLHQLEPSRQKNKLVFRSTDASIAAGQLSFLAIIETVFVLILYLWLAYRFEYQWWLYITAMAAPLILLRSDASVKRGVEMLRRHHSKKKEDFSTTQRGLLIGFTVIITGIISYFLAQMLLRDYQGWEFFWRATVLVAFAVEFAVVIVVMTPVSIMATAIGNDPFGVVVSIASPFSTMFARPFWDSFRGSFAFVFVFTAILLTMIAGTVAAMFSAMFTVAGLFAAASLFVFVFQVIRWSASPFTGSFVFVTIVVIIVVVMLVWIFDNSFVVGVTNLFTFTIGATSLFALAFTFVFITSNTVIEKGIFLPTIQSI